ncbi:RNA 2'-phosphotransferase [candidate division WOR-3 bacterium]|nr:RNA 2'-phosphotransferase [candidate division WOR-3 bacterium]
MDNRFVRISKFLCLVLRHKPETIGLALDEEGYADVTELMRKALDFGVVVDRPTLREVVEQADKKRFSFSADGDKIKANYGHSIPVVLDRQKAEPPELLYHGTARDSLASIAEHGLGLGTRQYVHLVEDENTAAEVGRRYGEPHVLKVAARRMHENGFEFFVAGGGIWLTKTVPAEYIT